jgi:hypothetical protein
MVCRLYFESFAEYSRDVLFVQYEGDECVEYDQIGPQTHSAVDF